MPTGRQHQQLPAFLAPLFWEYDLSAIDPERHAACIMARIMERGTWEAMQWLLHRYPRQRLLEFLQHRGKDRLPPREVNFWAVICGVPATLRRQWVAAARSRRDPWHRRHAS